MGKILSPYIILTPLLKAPQGIISPINNIRAHGGVWQGGMVMVPFTDVKSCPYMLYILTPQLKAPQCVISPTNGIRVHGGVRQGGIVMVPFADGVGTRLYLEPTQVHIAHGKPNKTHTTILEKDPTNRVVNGIRSKKNDATQGSHGYRRTRFS